jgi:hypothetical protein
MTDLSRSFPQSIAALFALDIAALIVCLVATVSSMSAWPAFILALAVFIIGGANWFALKHAGRFHPAATSAWALGLSALAWSIGLLAAMA